MFCLRSLYLSLNQGRRRKGKREWKRWWNFERKHCPLVSVISPKMLRKIWIASIASKSIWGSHTSCLTVSGPAFIFSFTRPTKRSNIPSANLYWSCVFNRWTWFLGFTMIYMLARVPIKNVTATPSTQLSMTTRHAGLQFTTVCWSFSETWMFCQLGQTHELGPCPF